MEVQGERRLTLFEGLQVAGLVWHDSVLPPAHSNISPFHLLLEGSAPLLLLLNSILHLNFSQFSANKFYSRFRIVSLHCERLRSTSDILSQNGQHSRECILSARTGWQIAYSSLTFLDRYHPNCTTCMQRHVFKEVRFPIPY